MNLSILPFWHRLQAVRSMSLMAHSKSGSGWEGEGQGIVAVTLESDSTLFFAESGVMKTARGDHNFQNAFRWRLDEPANLIFLEHLHRGEPVFLLSLTPVSSSRLVSLSPHLCGADAYAAEVDWDGSSVRLIWAVQGKSKNETVVYYYF